MNQYVKIDSLSLETENVETASYSNEITLSPKMRNYSTVFKIRPLTSGIMIIKGIKIRIGNLIYLNQINKRGIGNLYSYIKRDNPNIFQKYYNQHDINIENVVIAESVPIIHIKLMNFFPENLFYNENI